MPRHPGRVERVGRVSGKGWPALADSLPCPHHLKEGKRTRQGGWQTVEALPCCWSIGAEVVARCGDGIALNRTGWPSFHHPVRCCDRVRRLTDSDVADGGGIRRSRIEARNWRRWRRHPSPWFSLSSWLVYPFALPFPACFCSFYI